MGKFFLTLSIFFILLVVSVSKTSAQTPQGGSRINWQGQNWYLHGVNVPWLNWGCDFGCGASNGVVRPQNQQLIDTEFKKLKTANAHVVRWWVFPGDPWQISRNNATSDPTGLDSAIYADFNAALQLAETHDLYYVFVLFSSPASLPRSWIDNSTQRQHLADVLGVLFKQYENNPRILSWEVVNEPEYSVWGQPFINEDNLVNFGKAIINSIHTNSPALASIGNAHLDGMWMWTDRNTPVDFYSPHWYPSQNGNTPNDSNPQNPYDSVNGGGWCARCTNYNAIKTRFGITKPIIIGEWYADNDPDDPSYLALPHYNYWYDNGYAGAWGWSLFPNRTSDGLIINATALSTFGNSKADIGPRSGLTIPTPTNTIVPTPTRTPTPTLTPTPGSTFTGRFFKATLTPVSGSSAQGRASIMTNTSGTSMRVITMFSGIAGTIETASHVHGPKPATGIVFSLNPSTQAGSERKIDTTIPTLSTQQLQDLRGAKYYVNVHSSTFPSGEISGDLIGKVRRPGDVDGDDDIDIFDYNQVVSEFGNTGIFLSDVNENANNPGGVDIFDYNFVVSNFGT